MTNEVFKIKLRCTIVVGICLASGLGAPHVALAQALKDVRTPDTPLVLKAQGSFFVGGDKAEQTQAELGDLGPGGHITVNQMYVRFMVPQDGAGNVPVVMVHGATLTGKSWETTPDGRMGWDEYFVRKGHPVYVPDQVGRGRSGFNQARFNDARVGAARADSLPRWIRFSDEVVWPNFRFGLKPGEPFSDSQFPVAAVDELSKQGVPDVNFGGVPVPNPTFKALSDLATQLNGAVLMGHSQAGPFPLFAALLNPSAAKGLVLVEPGTCPSQFTDEQIKTLATIPILVLFGDHRDTPTGISIRPSWQVSFDSCQALIARIKAAGGRAEMLDPSASGIRGNSHMIMQDRNSLQIADLILDWIDRAVSRPRRTSGMLELEDYATLPMTADNTNDNTRAQLARVNFMRDEPGGRRFFVNDLNGPLYILDKQTKTFTKYLDFNGAGDRPGLFPKFTFERNFATGLINFIFDPDYARNGVFYTLHMEDPSINAPAAPKSGVAAGLDLAGYTTTPALTTPTVDGRIEREVVLIEWRDRDPSNNTFEGTARELLRLQEPMPIHPLGEMTFNPSARPGDADWRVMYLGSGDGGSGEQRDSRRLNPLRLDTYVGKILRIIPDLKEHTTTSTVSANGRYRIPNNNPFSTVAGARKEIWAYGLRNPHRLIWDVDAARPRTPTLLAFNIGLVTWETVEVIHRGANYGYPLREGTQSMSSTNGMGPLPARDMIPVQISDTVARGEVKPTYPVIQYPHSRESGGDAIAGGFFYRGKLVPALRGRLLFGDITTGRVWYANRADVLAADDGNAVTVAPIYEMDADLRRVTEQTYRTRGGAGQSLPGTAMVAGRGRVDLRFAQDNDGELYIMTKSDGMIRKVVGAKTATSTTAVTVSSRTAPVANGKRAYDANCAGCHGDRAQGAVKAGLRISIIEEQGGKQPPDLTDNQWDHGSTDGDIFRVIKSGLPPTMMPGFGGRIPDADIRRIVGYLRSLDSSR